MPHHISSFSLSRSSTHSHFFIRFILFSYAACNMHFRNFFSSLYHQREPNILCVCVCSHKNGFKWIWKHEEMRLEVDTAKRLMSLSLSLSFFILFFCLRKHTISPPRCCCMLTDHNRKRTRKNAAHTVSIILNTSLWYLESMCAC